MRVCILSMQNVQNHGSLLQSYSLKKTLEFLGHDISFIDIEPNEKDNLLAMGNVEDYSFESGNRGILEKIKRFDKYAINRLRIRKLADKQNVIFNDFRENVLKVGKGSNGEKFDFCVIGSDEVFNCNVASPWGFTSQLFGNVRQAENIITYAASCGSTIYENLTDGVKKRIKDSFLSISAFSVRDKNTSDFVHKLTGNEPIINLDPVMIENFKEEMENEELPKGLPKRYCIVYSYYNRINNKEEIKYIKEFCKKKNMDIVSIGAPQMWIHNHLVLNPFQMLRVFQNADFIITDTFHGTIFSVKYAKGFAVLVRKSNKNKLLDLIERLEIKQHMVNSLSELESAFQCEKNWSAIDEIAIFERARTISYLKENLRV